MKFGIIFVSLLGFINSQARAAEVPTQTFSSGGKKVEITCLGCEIEIQNPTLTSDILDWGLELGFFYLMADGGPATGGLEFRAGVSLHMGGPAWWKFKFGPGFEFDGEQYHATLSESAGPSFEVTDWFHIDFGALHVASFGRDGGALNAVGAELGLGFMLYKGLKLDLSGWYGRAWFPVVRQERTPDWEKSEVRIESIQETGNGQAGGGSVNLGWWF